MQRQIIPTILTLCAGLLPALALHATEPATAAPKAVLVESIADAGTVAKGEKITHDFIIENRGDAVLEINDVKPACGCTVAEFDRTVAPGASGKVHAVLDTSTFAGPISKQITIFTNDPENPRMVAAVRADVQPYLFVQPGFARFIQPQGSEPGEVREIVWTRSFDKLEILGVESPYPFLSATYRRAAGEEPREEGTGPQWVVTLTLDYRKAPVGNLADWVTVTTNHPEQPTLKIPVSGFVRPMIAVTPEAADFGRVESRPQVARMILRSFAKEKIVVTSAVSDVPGVEVEVSPIEDGRRFNLTVTVGPEVAPGEVEGTITIRTDLDAKPVVTVPLRATVVSS